MNYFITTQGLVSFEMPVSELMDLLTDNIKRGDVGYHPKARTRDKLIYKGGWEVVEQQLKKAAQAMMDTPYCIFKHPDMLMIDLMEMVEYQQGLNDAGLSLEESGMYEILYNIGKVSIITSFTTEDFFGSADYSIQIMLVSQPIFQSWERNLMIDTVLKELA